MKYEVYEKTNVGKFGRTTLPQKLREVLNIGDGCAIVWETIQRLDNNSYILKIKVLK